MLELVVTRKWSTPTSTCGIMSISGVFFSYTLERQLFQPGMTKPYAIPVGTYQVLLQPSSKFQELWHLPEPPLIPHLQNVPDFDAIEIHPANYPSDLLGCIGVGSSHVEEYLDPRTGLRGGAVFGSDDCFSDLMQKMRGADSISISCEEIG
jgi:hypothetical protein